MSRPVLYWIMKAAGFGGNVYVGESKSKGNV
jgi:hypothetical protein